MHEISMSDLACWRKLTTERKRISGACRLIETEWQYRVLSVPLGSSPVRA
jgi:hypothetical protein